MSNVTYEAAAGKTPVTEEKLWTCLIKDGLAKGQGSLDDSAIAALSGVGAFENTANAGTMKCKDSQNGGKTVEAVIGIDTRTEVIDVDSEPYKSVVLLIMKYGDEKYRGTGFMIKDDIVLTAAHNIYDRKKSAAADEVYVIGNQKDTAHVRCYSKFKVPFDYVAETSQDGHYDWGLIKLNAPMPDLGVIEVAKAVPGIVSETALIAGYPGEVRNVSTTDMWEASGAIDKYDTASQTLKYKISTSGGNSGSPVVVDYNGGKAVVGIHVMGNAAENTAKAIDDEVIAAINQFH